MDKLDVMSDAEFFGPEFRLLGEQPAHVDADAADAVIAGPGAQHLPRTAAEVEHPGPRFPTQRRAESGELFGCEGVVDAVSTFSDVEDPWDVHCGNISLRVVLFHNRSLSGGGGVDKDFGFVDSLGADPHTGWCRGWGRRKSPHTRSAHNLKIFSYFTGSMPSFRYFLARSI